MRRTEYIVPIDDESRNIDYIFIGEIRKQSKLIRCKDCLYWRNYCRVVDGVTSHHVCGRKRELDGTMHRSKANDFCSWAERKEEE